MSNSANETAGHRLDVKASPDTLVKHDGVVPRRTFLGIHRINLVVLQRAGLIHDLEAVRQISTVAEFAWLVPLLRNAMNRKESMC